MCGNNDCYIQWLEGMVAGIRGPTGPKRLRLLIIFRQFGHLVLVLAARNSSGGDMRLLASIPCAPRNTQNTRVAISAVSFEPHGTGPR